MRLVIAAIVLGLCAPIVGDPGTAVAQVWKVKKKAGATATKTTAAKPTRAKRVRTARPAVKKKSRSSGKRKVELVPDENAEQATESVERPRDDEADEPIIIQVEEID